jgi:hypothetical protein
VDARELPADLIAVLGTARRVEAAAVTRRQYLAALRATTGLVHRARAEGWTYAELAPALGMKVRTLVGRVERAPAAINELCGVVITPPPPREGHSAPPLPLEQREWLTSVEARQFVGIRTTVTFSQWRRAGMLPRTRTDAPGKGYLYARTDLLRIINAPRNGRGIIRAAV